MSFGAGAPSSTMRGAVACASLAPLRQVSRYQPTDLNRACVDLRGRRRTICLRLTRKSLRRDPQRTQQSMIGPARPNSLRNVHFLRSQQSPRKSPPVNGGAKAWQAPDGFREQNGREKTRSTQLLLQTRVGRHGQSNGGSASPRWIVSNLRAIGIFPLFSDELLT
jgi:hypothetical protein